MNSTTAQGSVCKHKAQYKCYFTQAQMVVCHMCPNTAHILCCLNKLKEQQKKFATKDNYLIITCRVRCHNKVVSCKTVIKGESSSLEGSKKTDDSGSNKYTSWHNDNPSKPEKTSMNILYLG
jgi:hypothetical protein